MGISWSFFRRNNRYYHQRPPPPPHQLLPPTPYYYPSEPQPYPPPAPPPRALLPPPTPPPPPVPPNFVVAPNTSYSVNPYPPQPPIHSNYYHSGWSNTCNYSNPYMARPNYHYYSDQGGGWPQVRPPPSPSPPLPRVEHQNAKKVKNAVNVRKDTIQLEIDEDFPDHYLISFVFDALFDGRITIYYFAKEEDFNCKFDPIYPDTFTPIEVPFQKGVGLKFRQPSGTGIDLGFFELDHLANPSPEEDVFPVVISAESVPIYDEDTGRSTSAASSRLQVTQAVLEKKNGEFQVKVVRQLLLIDGVRYELRDLYGVGTSSSSAQGLSDDEPGKECVICMTEPKNTAVLPCRHLCMCGDCAKELTRQSNKCPICRQPIQSLMGISTENVNEGANRNA